MLAHSNRLAHGGNRNLRPPLWVLYALMSFPVLLLFVFNYIPTVSAIYHSFTEWDLGADSRWIGTENYTTLFSDPVFLKSLMNLGVLYGISIGLLLTIPFFIAELIYHLKSERWSYLCRIIVVLPMLVPGIVFFLLWRFIYSDSGFVTQLMIRLGLENYVYGWLSHPDTALLAIAFMGFPFASGFHVLVYYAGLMQISKDVLENADIDGFSTYDKIKYLHLPSLLPQIRLLIVVTTIGVVNGFEAIYILTGDGGPGYETMVPGLYMFLNGFGYQQMGYASAIGMVLLVFLLAFTYLINRSLRKS